MHLDHVFTGRGHPLARLRRHAPLRRSHRRVPRAARTTHAAASARCRIARGDTGSAGLPSHSARFRATLRRGIPGPFAPAHRAAARPPSAPRSRCACDSGRSHALRARPLRDARRPPGALPPRASSATSPTAAATSPRTRSTSTSRRARRSRTPVVIYVHGGGFSMLSKETHRVMALAMRARATSSSSSTTASARSTSFPRRSRTRPRRSSGSATTARASAATRRASRIAGESAGGNLVTALAVATSWRRPEPFAQRALRRQRRRSARSSPPTASSTSEPPSTTSAPALSPLDQGPPPPRGRAPTSASTSARRPPAAPLASPLLVLERRRARSPAPPFFADVGTRDPLLGDSRGSRPRSSAGGTCELHVAPGEIHGYDAMVWRASAREKWRRVHEFLARHLATRRDRRAAQRTCAADRAVESTRHGMAKAGR